MKSFLTGLATGLAIGYLTAPRSGQETRRQLTDAANQQSKGLKDQWNKLASQAKQAVENAKSSLSANSSKQEPNLFADMQSGKLDKYLDDPQEYKNRGEETYGVRVEYASGTGQL